MKRLILIPILFLAGCAYSGPKLKIEVGFMGANVGVTLGSDPVIQLPPVKALAK